MKSHTQTDDSTMQVIQNNIIKAATNFNKIHNECVNDMGEAMVEMGTNAGALLDQRSKLITGLQIYGGLGSMSHGFKIWPDSFQDSGPIGPILFSCK